MMKIAIPDTLAYPMISCWETFHRGKRTAQIVVDILDAMRLFLRRHTVSGEPDKFAIGLGDAALGAGAISALVSLEIDNERSHRVLYRFTVDFTTPNGKEHQCKVTRLSFRHKDGVSEWHKPGHI